MMSEPIGRILIRKKIISEADLKAAMERQQQEPGKYLGQILCEMGFPQSRIVRAIFSNNKRKRIGEILVDRGALAQETLDEYLLEQQALKKKGVYVPLGTLLVQRKIVSGENYLSALSAHFSMPVVSLVDCRASAALQRQIGEAFAARNRIVVLQSSPRQLTVAVAQPDPVVFEQLEKAMLRDKSILFCLAPPGEIESCLDQVYDPFRKNSILD